MPKNNQDTSEFTGDFRSELVRAYIKQLRAHLQNLNTEYWRYITRTGKRPMLLNQKANVWDVYFKWHEYQLEKHDKEDFAGLNDPQFMYGSQRLTHQEVAITASESDVFKNFTDIEFEEVDLYVTGIGTVRIQPWQMRFSNKFLNKLRYHPEPFSILEPIFNLQLGFISDSQILDTGPIMYLAGFSKFVKGNQTVIYAVAPERVPVVADINGKTQIVGFKFRQYMRIIDLVNTVDKKSFFSTYQNFQYYIQSDPDKWNPFMPGQFLENQSQALNASSELLDISNIVNFRDNQVGLLYSPLLKSQIKLTMPEAKAFQLIAMRWKNLNKEIIEKCTSEESCKWLLQFLQKIPNFNLRLTEQEQKLITTPGNILCIGRSGTGKTTSAVLRLFALEILFKIRSTLFLKKDQSLKSSNFSSEDAEQMTGLHSVIVTASPVLTNEIRRFYTNLKNKVINELKKRDEKKKLKEKQKAMENQEASQNLEEPELPDQQVALEKQISKEHEQKEEDDINDDEILDAEEMEQNLSLPQSMAEMKNNNFPAFLTIKRLVFMIDASLRRPFFARNLKNEIIGLDSQAEWHNEQKGVLMINNYYKIQPEVRQKTPKTKNEDDLMDLSSSSEDEDEDYNEDNEIKEVVHQQVQKSKRKKTKMIQGEKVVQEYAQEVDYETFEKKFWNKYCYREKNITPATAWTEIYSVIKGSHNSSEFQTKGLPLEKYQGSSSHKSLLSAREKEKIYQYYTLYEKWKKEIKGFDFMDLVNHILREMQGSFYQGATIHFMLVDEVQDLAPATIKLLLKVTEQNVYFAGDTAQTIAKGVGFRFCDLKQMLNMTDFQAPKVLQLTVNFRSHNKILTLANSIISAIELFFPHTIDKLIKEKSNIDGLKPIVLDSNLLDSLFYVLLGNKDNKKQGLLGEKGGNAEFGCDQVIIVRDQESKKKVPSVLQHALCLTVYECKGLEFDDVILYNFFNDAPEHIHEQWKILNSIQIEQVKEIKKEVNEMQDLDDLNFDVIKTEEEQKLEEQEYQTNAEQAQQEYEYANRFYLSYQKENVSKEYNGLCTDLKQLYVCITRPKKRLIIYDENPESREYAMKYWAKLNAVDVISEDLINSTSQSNENLTEEQKQLLEKLREGQEETQQENENDPAKIEQKRKGWKIQGIKMFKRKYYEQAMKCFDHAGDEILKQRALGYHLAENASKSQSEAESLQYRLEDQSHLLDKPARRSIREQITQLKAESLSEFKQASNIFVEIGLKKQAAQCLFTAEEYIEAAKLFQEIGYYSQAGEAFFILKDYNRAAMLYSEGKLVTKAVDCYKKMQNWDAILSCVKNYETEFTQEQREELIHKYVPLALNSLYSIMTNDNLVDPEDEEDQDNIKKGDAFRIKDYEVNTTVKNNIIDEEDSEDEEGNADGLKRNDNDQQQNNEEVKSDKSENSNEEASDILTDQSKISINDGNSQSQFEIISSNMESEKDQKSQANKSKVGKSESEFSIISSNQNKSSLTDNELLTESFEHLSQFDPEDEFIKSRTHSVLESVISGDYKNKSGRSELSDYSMIDVISEQDGIVNNDVLKKIIQERVNLIQTKRDIYAEDILMTKIIYYVSQFSNDVKSYLSKLRSKDALLSVNKKPEEYEQINTVTDNKDPDEYRYDFDLENLDEEFLNILLDCLESFELYKLCLIVCNRYHFLSERVGRYLVSIASKYSNIHEIATKFAVLYVPSQKEVQNQVSFVAHQAVHSALELIEPKYLKIKEGNLDNSNSLGSYCYTSLKNLGFWKKLIYLMDIKSSLTVASMFADFQNFRQIYLAFYKKSRANQNKENVQAFIQMNTFHFLCGRKLPKDEIQTTAFMAALDSVIWNVLRQLDVKISDIKFPKCFSLTKKSLKIIRNQYSADKRDQIINDVLNCFEQRMILLMSDKPVATSSNQYEDQCMIYDTGMAIFLFIQSGFKENESAQVHLLANLSPQQFQSYLRALNRFMHVIQKNDTFFRKSTFLIIRSMLTVLRIRTIDRCDALYDNYGDKVMVHSSSQLAPILTKELEDRKKKLAEKVTAQVFEEFNINFHTRTEINSIIKKRLRDAYHKESLNNLIEIIDLEANFIRAPLNITLEKSIKHIYNYIQNAMIRNVDMSICFKNKQELDNLQYPFSIISKYQTIVEALNSNVEVYRFIYKRSPEIKQIAIALGQKEIVNQNSLEYHLKLEEEQKIQKQINNKKYLVQIGLLTEKDLAKFKTKILNQKQKQDGININQSAYTKNITYFSLVFFDNLPNLNAQTNQNLLDVAYSYWEFFTQTKTNSNDTEPGDIQHALLSLAVYIATDNYMQFMQMLQRQLHSASLERKMLFSLIDAHVFKKYGNMLESSSGIMEFLKQQKGYSISLDSYYLITLLEMAFVYIVSVNSKLLHLPYEHLRYLAHLFGQENEENKLEKQNFLKQVNNFNSENLEGELSFTITNSKYQLIDQADQTRFNGLIKDIIDYAQFISNNSTDNYTNQHLYLLITALVINLPNIADENNQQIAQILNQLHKEEVIFDDNVLMEYTSFKKLSQDFKEVFDYDYKNQMLYLEYRESQQSCFVNVLINTIVENSLIKEQVDKNLKDAEELEIIQSVKQQKLADLIKPKLQEYKAQYQKKKQRVMDKNKKFGMTVNDHLLLNYIGYNKMMIQSFQIQVIEAYRQSANLSKLIRGVTLHSTFENVIDLHYLLNQIHKIETEINPQLHKLLFHSYKPLNLDQQVQEISNVIDLIQYQVGVWSQNKYAPSKRQNQKQQRIMKLKWKEHAMKMKQKLMAKVAARKREDAVAKKKDRLKNRKK